VGSIGPPSLINHLALSIKNCEPSTAQKFNQFFQTSIKLTFHTRDGIIIISNGPSNDKSPPIRPGADRSEE
jgi:hypothetical protein